MWPFVKEIAVVRISENRESVTLETKSIIVNKEAMRVYVIEKVIPTIQVVTVDGVGQPIFIQQDNARTHILPNDSIFNEVVVDTGLDIRLMQQPANSPDMKAFDVGFFSSVHSLSNCRVPKTFNISKF